MIVVRRDGCLHSTKSRTTTRKCILRYELTDEGITDVELDAVRVINTKVGWRSLRMF